MSKLEDLDIAFAFGTMFGAGIIGSVWTTTFLVKSCKRWISAEKASSKLYEELDSKYKNEEDWPCD